MGRKYEKSLSIGNYKENNTKTIQVYFSTSMRNMVCLSSSLLDSLATQTRWIILDAPFFSKFAFASSDLPSFLWIILRVTSIMRHTYINYCNLYPNVENSNDHVDCQHNNSSQN